MHVWRISCGFNAQLSYIWQADMAIYNMKISQKCKPSINIKRKITYESIEIGLRYCMDKYRVFADRDTSYLCNSAYSLTEIR